MVGGIRWHRQSAQLACLDHLQLVTRQEAEELREALATRHLPTDFEAKLARLAGDGLSHSYIEQNCRWFFALLLAARDGSFTDITPSDRERLLRVLAYVRKDDDAIPDYLPGGFADDQQEVRAAVRDLAPVIQRFKAWHLCHQVPALWFG